MVAKSKTQGGDRNTSIYSQRTCAVDSPTSGIPRSRCLFCDSNVCSILDRPKIFKIQQVFVPVFLMLVFARWIIRKKQNKSRVANNDVVNDWDSPTTLVHYPHSHWTSGTEQSCFTRRLFSKKPKTLMQQTCEAHVEVISDQEFFKEFDTDRRIESHSFPRSKLKIPGVKSRTTIWNWDLILKANVPDYLMSPNTGQLLWDKGWDLNLHQLWCIKKVSLWMRTHPCPTYKKLRAFLKNNKNQFSHRAFFEELFHV